MKRSKRGTLQNWRRHWVAFSCTLRFLFVGWPVMDWEAIGIFFS